MREGRQSTAYKVAAIAAFAVFLGCQQQTPEQKLIKKTDAVGPWLAALQMAGEKWTVNSVPARFVRTSVDAAQKAFSKAARETERSDARPDLRNHLGRLIAGGQAEGARLRRAVAAKDRRAAVPAIRALAALHADFEALSKSIEEPSQ